MTRERGGLCRDSVSDATGATLFSGRHRFVRPGLCEKYGLDTAKAEHTANFLGWMPDPMGASWAGP